MIEKIYNIWLLVKSYMRFAFSIKPNLRKPKEVSKYKLSFCDFFIGNELDQKKWLVGQPWGEFHPDFPYEYYGQGEEFVKVDEGSLNLFARYKPKKFYDFKKNLQITINHGKGLIFSKQSFKYGYYEVSGILPKGKYLWSAIWLTADKSWPPEIDIVEAYSGEKSDYSNKCGIRNFEFSPNLHFGFKEDDTKDNYGGNSYPLPFNPTDRPVIYGVHWSEESIRFYYDGYLIFQTKNEKILKYFNKPEVSMHIILNNGFQPEINNLKSETSVFKIYSVKFFSKY